MLNLADDTTLIDAGDECYFDIIINPALTEVSISYNISINLSSQENTIPAGTKIKKYEKYVGTNYVLDSTTNIDDTAVSIVENINLENNQITLGNSAIRKYRFYCVLPEYINVQQGDELVVIPTITVQQNVANN